MARIYVEKPSFFGPVAPSEASPEEAKIDNELIKRGYTRVQENIKTIRQQFSAAVTSGRRSGSGKIVLEYYDELLKIWDGCPAAEPLPFGTSSSEVNNTDRRVYSDDDTDNVDFNAGEDVDNQSDVVTTITLR